MTDHRHGEACRPVDHGADAPVAAGATLAATGAAGTPVATGAAGQATIGDVRRSVAARRPADEREATSRRRILVELDRLERPLDRTAGPVHVTGSAVLAGRRGTVLHRHKRLGLWLQPGGHLDPGETPAEAARREAVEETGLDARHVEGGPLLVHVDVHGAADGHVHLDLRYLLLAGDDDPAPAAGESPHVAWFTWADALDRADASLAGALRSAMAAPAVRQLAVPSA